MEPKPQIISSKDASTNSLSAKQINTLLDALTKAFQSKLPDLSHLQLEGVSYCRTIGSYACSANRVFLIGSLDGLMTLLINDEIAPQFIQLLAPGNTDPFSEVATEEFDRTLEEVLTSMANELVSNSTSNGFSIVQSLHNETVFFSISNKFPTLKLELRLCRNTQKTKPEEEPVFDLYFSRVE